MKISLSIPDELYETYIKKFGIQGAHNRMKQAIDAYKEVELSDRAIIVASDNRRAIEAVFQTTIDDAPKLVKLIQNMSRVSLGNIDMEFSSDQLARMEAQAGFHGRTLEQYIRETVKELKETMLERC